MPSAPEGAQEAWKWEWGPDSQLVQTGAGNQDLLANRHLPLCWIVLPPFFKDFTLFRDRQLWEALLTSGLYIRLRVGQGGGGFQTYRHSIPLGIVTVSQERWLTPFC